MQALSPSASHSVSHSTSPVGTTLHNSSPEPQIQTQRLSAELRNAGSPIASTRRCVVTPQHPDVEGAPIATADPQPMPNGESLLIQDNPPPPIMEPLERLDFSGLRSCAGGFPEHSILDFEKRCQELTSRMTYLVGRVNRLDHSTSDRLYLASRIDNTLGRLEETMSLLTYIHQDIDCGSPAFVDWARQKIADIATERAAWVRRLW